MEKEIVSLSAPCDFAVLDNIRTASSRLKGKNLKRLNQVSTVLGFISQALSLESEQEAIVFVSVFDRQCGGRASTIEEISSYLEISSLDVMQFVAPLNSLTQKGYLNIDNRFESLLSEKQFAVNDELFYAIIEGRKIDIAKMLVKEDFDQFDFCQGVSSLKEQRKNETINTRKLFINVKKLEDEHPQLQFVSELRSMIKDVESRTLFYEMCKDYSEASNGRVQTDLCETIEDIYDRVLERAKVKKSILNSTNPLIKEDLIIQCGDDELKLTPKGIKMLFGEQADAMVQSNKVADRYEFVNKVYRIVDGLHHDPSMMEKRAMMSEFREFERDNNSLSMVEKVHKLIDDSKARLIFYLVANELLDACSYCLNDISSFCNRSQEVKEKRLFKEGRHILIVRDLVEVSGGGLFDAARLTLTEKGKELFLEDDMELFESKVDTKDLIQPKDIVEKQLFFDKELQDQLSMLGNSISQENYEGLCQRLVQNNLPKGVAVLLYGHPGTGKTESVMQLARKTGRPVLHVDIAATKTCWFGESEKLIKDVFTKYRKLCDSSKVKPILLFNEADAVFSKRKDTNLSSVAQTENAMQNIILEEMEKLDGILIATTNMADNLDRAFERRFLFKIRFDTPTIEARTHIWMDKLKTLSLEEAQRLAGKYDLSGGEIDNITRKVIMAEVIEGKRPSLEKIISFCDQEKIVNKTNKVGF